MYKMYAYTLGFCGIGVLVDFVRMPQLIAEANSDAARRRHLSDLDGSDAGDLGVVGCTCGVCVAVCFAVCCNELPCLKMCYSVVSINCCLRCRCDEIDLVVIFFLCTWHDRGTLLEMHTCDALTHLRFVVSCCAYIFTYICIYTHMCAHVYVYSYVCIHT